MPRCVLEMLAVGRPVVAVHLPQLHVVIRDGESGFIVPRGPSDDAMAERLADRFVALRDSIMRGALDPVAIARLVEPFTPRTQLARVFHIHREIQPTPTGGADGAGRAAGRRA
jgi:glycosyltransferase involved in cell wall biosynthesis